MNTLTPIPVITGRLAGQSVPLVDARLLHGFLEVGRDFSNWIKDRVAEYEFIEGEDFICIADHRDFSPNRGKNHRATDFSPNPAKNRRGRPNRDYFLTLDMAKELAMVERTPRGRQARRYFIACEQQLRQLQSTRTVVATPSPLSRAQRQAVNRQAWVDVSGEVHDLFHRRREALLQHSVIQDRPVIPAGGVPPSQLWMYRPAWAR
jgi:phage anti-repressor protein